LLAQGYGVTAWWDRGYWITRIARRVPSANPTQAGAGRVANVFLAADEQEGVVALDRLRARYVIVDDTLPPRWIARRTLMVGAFADAVATTGRNPDDYYQVYERRLPDGTSEPILLFYPRYYQAFAVRLAAFQGRAVRPPSISVAVFHLESSSATQQLMLDELKTFPSSEEAAAFIAAAPLSRRLASADPFTSCVPVDAVGALAGVHRSPNGSVQIFERR
jgi:dolichyl-diphosphooligosaccharide--protein glycosyltransferase